MPNVMQLPPVLIARATALLLSGRIHFKKTGIGRTYNESEEDYVVFRTVVRDPSSQQPENPGAIFKVQFHFAKYSTAANKKLSLIPIPLIVAQPGFRSKSWMLGQDTGKFQGYYEWDTVEDAENYWNSFPMELMKKRARMDSLSHVIITVNETEPAELTKQV